MNDLCDVHKNRHQVLWKFTLAREPESTHRPLSSVQMSTVSLFKIQINGQDLAKGK